MLSQNESEASKLKVQGNAFFNEKKYLKAIDCYTQAILLEPTFKEAWLNKALCHQELNQIQDALDALTQAIEIEPQYAKAVFNKVKLLISIKLYQLALDTIDFYTNDDGDNKEIIVLRKSCAEQYVKQMLGKNAAVDPVQLFKLGQQYQKQGNLKEAKKYFDAVIALDPEHESARGKLFEVTANMYDGVENTLFPAQLVTQMLLGNSPQEEKKLISERLNSMGQAKNINNSTANPSQQLLNAIKSGDVNGVQAAINVGADVNALLITGNFPQYTPHSTKESINQWSLESMLRFCQAQPQFGESPLYLASSLGKLNIVDCLLRNGADVNQADNYGLTALMIAINEGHVEVALRLLAEQSINVNHAIQDRSTALSFACEKGQQKVVIKLIEKGAEVNHGDEDGETPLIIGVRHKQLTPILLQAGANPNLCTHNGVSPLFFAAQTNQLEMLKQLIVFGALIEAARKSDQMNSLLIAAYEGHAKIVFYLLACGADYTVRCDRNLSVIDYAKHSNHSDQLLYKQLLNYQSKRSLCVSEYEKGINLLVKGDYQLALSIFSKLSGQYVELHQKHVSLDLAKCFSYIAECYIKLGKIDQVIEYIKKSYEIYCSLFGEKHVLTKEARLHQEKFINKSSEHSFFNDTLQLNILLNPKSSNHISVDLHGSSVQETKVILADTLNKMDANNITEFYVITGWGKHINSQGSRGVLKKILPDLLKPYALSISDIQEEKGAYKIILAKANELEQKQKNAYRSLLNEKKAQILIKQYQQEIKQGNVVSMVLLADLYLYLDSSEKNYTSDALNLLHQAKTKGSLQACVKLGEIYREGKKVKPNLKKAFGFFEEAAKAEYPLGQYWLGKCYLTGECVKRDDKLGFLWMKKAADAGIAYAQQTLGESYFKGDFTPLDEFLAFEYYKKAADQGLLQSQIHVARSYACGYGVTPDYLKAFQYYWLAAQQEDTYAICQIASYLNSDRLGEPDLISSFQWFLKGAKLTDVDCQAMTAIFYYQGRGIKQDIEKSCYWANQAHAKGNKLVLWLFSTMCFTGVGATKDHDKALNYLLESAESGCEIAQQELIMRYMMGEGVPKDVVKAEQLQKHYEEIKNKNFILPKPLKQNNTEEIKTSSKEYGHFFAPSKNTHISTESTNKEKVNKSFNGGADQLFKGIFSSSNKKDEDENLTNLLKKYELANGSVEQLEKGLRMAAVNNEENDIDSFIKLGANINAFNKDGKTALHYAIERSHFACVQKLLGYGALYNVPDSKEKTAFDYAEDIQNTEILNLFPKIIPK